MKIFTSQTETYSYRQDLTMVAEPLYRNRSNVKTKDYESVVTERGRINFLTCAKRHQDRKKIKN